MMKNLELSAGQLEPPPAYTSSQQTQSQQQFQPQYNPEFVPQSHPQFQPQFQPQYQPQCQPQYQAQIQPQNQQQPQQISIQLLKVQRRARSHGCFICLMSFGVFFLVGAIIQLSTSGPFENFMNQGYNPITTMGKAFLGVGLTFFFGGIFGLLVTYFRYKNSTLSPQMPVAYEAAPVISGGNIAQPTNYNYNQQSGGVQETGNFGPAPPPYFNEEPAPYGITPNTEHSQIPQLNRT